MQLNNPNDGKPFDKFYDEIDSDGKPYHKWGSRNVDGHEEIVLLTNNQSNMHYWQPEKVLSPEGCNHEFVMTSVGKREIECPKCHFATSFIAGVNFFEENGKLSVKIRNNLYPVSK